MRILRLTSFISWLAVTMMATSLSAQDSGALIDALIRKGILSNQEAEDIRAELVRENSPIPAPTYANGKSTHRLSVGMRMQAQYAYLDTDVVGAAADPVATNHAFLRRMYLTLRAAVSADWSATFTYDFASSGYDDAYLEYRPNPDLIFNFGLRKVNVAYEERASSGNIRATERSAATRYFVEANNGRRLGAASYRIGAFVDGRRDLTPTVALVYSVAITDPERPENFTLASAAGDQSNNRLSYWGNVGLSGKLTEGTWIAGLGAGHLPDQGGVGTAALGRGFDLTLYSAYTEITAGRFNLLAEYLVADVERGRSATTDARPQGLTFQPSLLLSETIEAVVRYSWVDSDGRGVTLSDVVRSAPNGGVMNRVSTWYAGANWYLRGNDMKYQLGLEYGKSTGNASAEASTVGVRSQLQLQF